MAERERDMKTYVLYNPKAGSGAGRDAAMKLRAVCTEELEFRDITAIESYADFFDRIGPSAKVILAGGDGTLNRFLNDTAEAMLPNPIYYYAVGSGNDFLRDLGLEKGAEPVCIDLYRKKLPLVEAGGHTYRFLNGVGYGIDGYCCEKGDALRDAGGKRSITRPLRSRACCFITNRQTRWSRLTVCGMNSERSGSRRR